MKERQLIALIVDDAPEPRASLHNYVIGKVQPRRDAARERELIKKKRALEAGFAALRREGAGRGRDEEARQATRACAGHQRIAASRPESAVNNQTQEQLQLLKTAIEQSNEPVIIMTAQPDPPGPRILFVSPAFTKMTGYAPESVIGKTLHVLEGPQTDPSVLSRMCQDCLAGEVFHGEMVNYRKDGSEVHLEWTAGPVRNERGEVTHIAAAVRDVTERRRIEEEAQRSAEEFRSLFDLSAVGMTQVSPEGRYLRVNRKLCHMLGYPEEELLQLTLHEVTHPDDRELSAAKLSSSFANGAEEYSIEKRYVRKDGAIIWVLINWTVVRDADGHPLRTVASIQDITARKRAEEALRESHAFNQAVLGSLAAHIAVLDSDGNIIAVNEAWKRFARENAGTAITDSVGMNYLDACRRAQEQGDEEAGTALNGIRAVLDGARPNFTMEYPRHSPEKKRWFLMSVTPLLGAGGGAVITHTDITERKQIEESLRVSEKRLELAQQAGNIGTFDWDIRANKVVWTEQLKTLFGLSPDSPCDTYESWLELILPEDRPVCEASMRAVLEKRLPQWQMEYRLVRADTGEVRWIDAKGSAFYDEQGEPLRFVGANMDITERKRVEAEREELLAREQAARATAEHATESIRRLQAMTDSALESFNLDDLLRDMLAGIRDLLATDTAAVLLLTEDGQSLSVRATSGWEETATDQCVPVGEGVAGSIAASRAPLVVEDLSAVEAPKLVLPRNARSLIGAPLIVEGRLIGVIQTGATETRRFTKDDVRLLKLAADRVALAIEHARLYEAEQQARRQAEEANRMKDEFLALVSHELRSPLNAILGYAALLRYGVMDARKAKHAADVIERSGRAQAQLIDDLLDTARIIGGKLRLEIEPVNLASVIEQAVQAIQPAADAKGISIETNLASDIGQITGDPARLQQVELHGGTVAAASAGEGKGATFTVTLPVRAVIASLEEAAAAPSSVEISRELAGVRALVVDDENDARELIETALTQYGAEVVAVGSAAEAYSLITTTPPQMRPNVMVIDIGMPDEDGYSLIRRVRKWEREQGFHIPAMALTAYGRVKDRVRALNASFQMHIAKPVDPAELAAVITSLIRRLNGGSVNSRR